MTSSERGWCVHFVPRVHKLLQPSVKALLHFVSANILFSKILKLFCPPCYHFFLQICSCDEFLSNTSVSLEPLTARACPPARPGRDRTTWSGLNISWPSHFCPLRGAKIRAHRYQAAVIIPGIVFAHPEHPEHPEHTLSTVCLYSSTPVHCNDL